MPILVFCATLFTVNKAIAQSPGTLTIRDNRNCEDTLFFLAEAEPLNNTPCGGPFGGTGGSLFSPNLYTYNYTNTSFTSPVRWIAVTFYLTEASGCAYSFTLPCSENFAQVGPCPATQYDCLQPNCAYYNCDLPISFTVTYPSAGSITIIIHEP